MHCYFELKKIFFSITLKTSKSMSWIELAPHLNFKFSIVTDRRQVKIGLVQGDQIRLWKNRPKCSPNGFLTNYYITLTVVKRSSNNLCTFVIYQKTTQRKLSPNRRKFAQSGHPVTWTTSPFTKDRLKSSSYWHDFSKLNQNFF
jgi:hypothetical protein